jgi:hypothetical protein
MAETDSRTGVGELTVLLPSWRLHLEASNLSPRTIRAYTDDGALLAAFLIRKGMPTTVANIRREHVEAFIAAELERTAPSSAATRYRSLHCSSGWTTRARSTLRRWPRCARRSSPSSRCRSCRTTGPGPARRLLGQGPPRSTRHRDHPSVPRYRHAARGHGRAQIQHPRMPTCRTWTCGRASCASSPSRREMVLPSGLRPRATLTGTSVPVRRTCRAAGRWLWLGKKGRLTPSGIYQMIKDRGAEIGLPELHPHQLRHTFSHDWPAADPRVT